MKTVGKIILFILGLLIVLVIALYLSLGFIVKKAVTTVVPTITQTTANIDNVDISLFSGHISFSDLAIGNPAGFSDKNAFQMKQMTVEFDPHSIFSDTIIIRDVAISGTQISAELNKKGEINLNQLYQNVNNFAHKNKKAGAQTTGQKTSDTGKGKTVSLKHLNVTDSTVNLAVLNQSMTIPLPDINYTDSGQKRSISETIALVLNKITVQSLTGIKKSGQELINKQLENIKEAAGKITREKVSDLTDKAQDGLQKGIGNLKNMFQ